MKKNLLESAHRIVVEGPIGVGETRLARDLGQSPQAGPATRASRVRRRGIERERTISDDFQLLVERLESMREPHEYFTRGA